MNNMNGTEIRVKGKVQGVGFRPYVWQLAHTFGLRGSVSNDSAGVLIHLWQNEEKLEPFLDALKAQCPPLASIQSITTQPYHWENEPAEFIIEHSGHGQMDTQIVPDAATCPACLAEVKAPDNRRYHYAFTNCTHCGPRFTIIRHMPYDRVNTSMAAFPMCPECMAEYQNPADRRFHAQPNACPVCGPQVEICAQDGVPLAHDDEAIDKACTALAKGQTLAVKGLGGFHLACDALNETAVMRLRERKHRPHKPFAVMLPDENWLKQCTQTQDFDALLKMLKSAAAPITLAQKNINTPLCHAVAPDLNEIGVMLPANPLQHLLLERYGKPLVMTSGNTHGKPPTLSNATALQDLQQIADLWLLHNRGIVQRADDSVVRVKSIQENTQIEMLRRSRGYVPDPIELPEGFQNTPTILAMGGDLKNVFCFLRGSHAILSQHLGDLADIDIQQQQQDAIALFKDIYQLTPDMVAVDAHPAYFSRRIGQKIAADLAVPVREIFHHHAHIASCMAEHGHARNAGAVIGLALDGIGYGQDQTFWGGECLKVDYQHCEKIGGLPAITLPGGDLAAHQPWRNLFAQLEQFVPDWQRYPQAACIPAEQIPLLRQAMQRQINMPKASSAGRLFDAVAAALGICAERISWEGQAACQLEALAQSCVPFDVPVQIPVVNNTLDMTDFWTQWLTWDADNAHKAYAFHAALAKAFAQLATQATKQHGTQTIVLSGGVMHNALLRDLLLQELSAYTVWLPQRLPAGDGGIAFGQALIAATHTM